MRGTDIFPWNDVETCRRNKSLQSSHSVVAAKSKFREHIIPCPTCSSQNLNWIYFVTPSLGMSKLAGRSGWLTYCGRCRCQVSFFRETVD